MRFEMSSTARPAITAPTGDDLRVNDRPVYVAYSRPMESWGVYEPNGKTVFDGFSYEEDAFTWLMSRTNLPNEAGPVCLARRSRQAP